MEATAHVSSTNFNLGADTIIDIGSNITYYGPSGMQSYFWFDGSANQSLHVAANFLGLGIHYISLEVTDSLKCKITDETILGVAKLVSVNELEAKAINIYPNPVKESLVIDAKNIGDFQIISSNGALVHSGTGISTIDVSKLETGLYVLKITVQGKSFVGKFVKE
jgi:hypothetical protein